MTKVELSEVLRAHPLKPCATCQCGAEHDARGSGESGFSWHARHLADVVLAWLVERAGDAAAVEHVANFVPLGFDPKRDPYRSTQEAARSILLSFVGTVAPELVPESHRIDRESDAGPESVSVEVQR